MDDNPYRAEFAPVLAEQVDHIVDGVPTVARRPWGPWATIGLSLVSGAFLLIAQTIGAIPAVVYRIHQYGDVSNMSGMQEITETLSTDGLVISFASVAGGLGAILSIGFWSWIRGWPWREYLALNRFSARAAMGCLAALAVFVAVSDGSSYLADRDIVPEFMVMAYETAGFLPLLFFAVVMVAPIWEELFFRGFMHRGLAAGFGHLPAIVICSACWAAMHVQYDAINIFMIFVFGLFLGAVRQKTGSTSLTILIHAAMNLVATLEAIVYMEFIRV